MTNHPYAGLIERLRDESHASIYPGHMLMIEVADALEQAQRRIEEEHIIARDIWKTKADKAEADLQQAQARIAELTKERDEIQETLDRIESFAEDRRWD